jgi:hypothetical protein
MRAEFQKLKISYSNVPLKPLTKLLSTQHHILQATYVNPGWNLSPRSFTVRMREMVCDTQSGAVPKKTQSGAE